METLCQPQTWGSTKMNVQCIVNVLALLSALLCIVASPVHAGAQYRVISAAGTVLAKTQASTWKSLQAGTSFESGTTIRLATDSYLAAIDPSGYPIECTRKGDTVLTYEPRSTKTSSALVKIAAYVIDRATAQQQSVLSTGSVTRSASISLKRVFPSDTRLLQDTVRLSWSSNNPMRVVVVDFMKTRLKTFDVQDSALLLDLRSIREERTGECLYWFVESVKDSSVFSEPACLLLATTAEREEVASVVQQMKTDGILLHDDAVGPLVTILVGAMYDQHGFKVEALHWYNKACSKAPNVSAYCSLRDSIISN
jgi:hypothetical protein